MGMNLRSLSMAALTMLMFAANGARAQPFSKLYDFNLTVGQGFQRDDALIASGGILYGMTTSGGAQGLAGDGLLFSFNTAGNSFTTLHEYGAAGDGDTPFGAPMLFGTTLYAMTVFGGANSQGAVVSFNTSNNQPAVLHSFTTVGGGPEGSLIPSANVPTTLYGMSFGSGANNAGSIFSYNTLLPPLNAYTDLYSFNNADGRHPYGTLTQSGNILYGTTANGGVANNSKGTIFSYNTSTNTEIVLHSFNGNIGGGVSDGLGNDKDNKLVIAPGGLLYGMAEQGGLNGKGLIYSYNINTNTFADLHDFAGGINDGANPGGSLILSPAGILYGMTEGGGASNNGTIFSFDPSIDDMIILH